MHATDGCSACIADNHNKPKLAIDSHATDGCSLMVVVTLSLLEFAYAKNFYYAEKTCTVKD